MKIKVSINMSESKRFFNKRWCFKNDIVKDVEFYARAVKITYKNFEDDFLSPTEDKNAKQCVAYLLDWKSKNLTNEQFENHAENQLKKDPFNVADMKKWSYRKQDDDTLCITGIKDRKRILLYLNA